MPTYAPAEAGIISFVQGAMKEHHRRLHDVELRIDVLMAYPDKDANGEIVGEAIKHGGYPCLATIKIRGPKERGEGRGDVLLTIDAYRWPELDDSEQNALIDHELTHVELKTNSDGVVKRDDYERPKLNMRLHDHQHGWFDEVARRHPLSSQEVQQFRRFVDSRGQIYLPGFGGDTTGDEGAPAIEKERSPKRRKKLANA